ncbi:MAG TPA: PDZ domain-containing protein [Polyangiaceae bacterium]|nr:PDZ domain-containing protein [Polyangiaceae bacterium]
MKPVAPRAFARAKPVAPRALALALLLAALAPGCRPSLGSVGAVFRQEKSSGRLWVRRVEPSMDGARAGLEPGDEVLSVEGRDVRDLSPAGVHEALSGPPGTTVSLTVARRGTIEHLRVVRKPYRKLGLPAAPPRDAPAEGAAEGRGAPE